MSISKNTQAIVAFALGAKYQRMFDDYCRDGWERYCKKYKYDLYLITDPLDPSLRGQSRSPSWQKLLILSQPWSARYERIVWIDTDILINADNAPDISCDIDIHKVGLVDAFSIPNAFSNKVITQRPMNSLWSNAWKTSSEYYQKNGLTDVHFDQVAHGGVFVCSPKFHRGIFEYIYYTYEDDPQKMQAEQPAFSYELLKNDLVQWLPSEFNYCVAPLVTAYYPFLLNEKISTEELRSLALTNLFQLGSFLHFAGCHHIMYLVKPTNL